MSQKKNLPILLIIMLLILNTSAGVIADEASTIQRFEHAKMSEPQLIAFIKAMPKGADLHSHVSGAVYAENRLDAAIERGMFFDPEACKFVSKEVPGTVSAKKLLSDSQLAAKYLDAVSMRGCYPAVESGHDHFFNSFAHMSVPMGINQLAEVISRAKAQNIQYLELMSDPVPNDAEFAALRNQPSVDNLDSAFAQMKERFPSLITAAKAYMDRQDLELSNLVGVKSPVTGVGGPVNFRYICSVNRTAPNADFFAQMACGMALVQADKRVVGVNILAPEDDINARQNFNTQMKMIDFLWKRMGKPNLTLHAGELTPAISPMEVMCSRIRKTVEIGHAKRIGHGVSIAWEDDLPGLLKEMRQKRVAVEICLTSNAGILDVSGDRHPFNLYKEAEIPINLNTDDEGVNRSNLTIEFVRAIRTYKLSYMDVKKLARNSIEYSFLPGSSLYLNGDYSKLRPEFSRVRSANWMPNEQARKLIAASDKLAIQIRLERAFVNFER